MFRPWVPRSERLRLLLRLSLRPARRRLSLLQTLLLLCVPLLQLLRLLLVPLLNLLLLRIIRFLLRQALMLLVLLLLQFLPFLVLLLLQLFLLLLIFLVQLLIPRMGGGGTFPERNVIRVDDPRRGGGAISTAGRGSPFLTPPVRRRVIRAPGFSRRDGFATAEFSRPGGCGDGRLAVVSRCPQFLARARSLYVL